MSKLKDCIRSGVVKNNVDAFVDEFQDLFDCFVTNITVSSYDNNGCRVDLILRRGEEE